MALPQCQSGGCYAHGATDPRAGARSMSRVAPKLLWAFETDLTAVQGFLKWRREIKEFHFNPNRGGLWLNISVRRRMI